MTRAARGKKAPVLWVCVETDTDGSESICDSCMAKKTAPLMLAAHRKIGGPGYKYRLVRYEPAKARGRRK